MAAATLAKRAPALSMPGTWSPIGMPDLDATAAEAARAVAVTKTSSVTVGSTTPVGNGTGCTVRTSASSIGAPSAGQRHSHRKDEASDNKEFVIEMPNLVRYWPPLEKFPVPLRSALWYLTSIDLVPTAEDELGPPILPSLRAEETPPPLTLVLDLDETLVHCKLECLESPRHEFCVGFEETTAVGYVYVRPYARLFLEIVSRLFEVVVFTASSHAYADQVLDKLDPEGRCLTARLYRQHCTEAAGAYLKDIRRLGRPLSKVVLVDNSPVSLALCPENGVIIKGWNADCLEDRELLDLLMLLQQSVQSSDVQSFLSERYSLREFFGELRRCPQLIGPLS